MSIHKQGANSDDFLGSQFLVRSTVCGHVSCSHSALFHRTVVAALDARVIVIARDQQESMALSDEVPARDSGGYADTVDFSPLIDIHCVCELQAGAGKNQHVQVDYRTVLPQECTGSVTVAGKGKPPT